MSDDDDFDVEQFIKDEGFPDHIAKQVAEAVAQLEQVGGVRAIHPVRLSGATARKEVIDGNVTGKLGGAWATQDETEAAVRYAAPIAQQLVADGRMIWIDEVPPVSVLMREASRAVEMFRDRFIKHPFEDGYVLAYNDSTWDRKHGDLAEMFGTPSLSGGSVVIVRPGKELPFPKDHPATHVFVFNYMEVMGKKSLEASGDFYCRVSETGLEAADFDDSGLEPMQKVAYLKMRELHGLMLFYSLMILNTEHVPIGTFTPSEKVNKYRVRRGKDPLPPYTHVYAEDYVTALTGRSDPAAKKVKGGTHAPPAPHLRRGHRRWLDAEHTRSTWVRDCLVNVRKTDLGSRARTFYDASKLH